jgi:hypothetical protein
MQHIIPGRRHFAVCTSAVVGLATIGTTTIIGAIEDQSGIKKPYSNIQLDLTRQCTQPFLS